jgi:serine/threonine protein kinase
MAPEQIRGQALDVRADIYSFGCMIHEFFSGKAPFTANSPAELLQRHLTSRPADLTVFDKNITPEFSKYVLSMMAKDPAARPATMKDVMMEIKTQKIFYNKPKPPEPEEQTKTAHE